MNISNSDVLNSGILIVDDDYLGRVVLREIFQKRGFSRIEEAENGEEALEKIASFKPNLVILDVLMPKMDGMECCRRIRAHPDAQISQVPILFQTALDSAADKTSMFEAGATDYLSKPVDQNEIIARSIVHMEREVMLRNLREFRVRVEEELDVARATQQFLVPGDHLISGVETRHNMVVRSHYKSSSELGGDFWGIKTLSEHEFALYIADFSGHGVNAALNVFRLHAVMQATIVEVAAPGDYLSQLNTILSEMLPVGQFSTMFYGVIDTRKNTICYASAASLPPVLLRAYGNSIELLEKGNSLLGAFKDATFSSFEVSFNEGDCLFLYSDALVETPDESGNDVPTEYWAVAFQNKLKEYSGDSKRAFAWLLEEFYVKCGDSLTDDLTMVTCMRNV